MITYSSLVDNATKLANNPMPSEKEAMSLLINMGEKFNFQVPFGFYILDFVIPSRCLIVEIDGSSHDTKAKYDSKRDSFCNRAGLNVLRIPDTILNELPALVKEWPIIANGEYVTQKAVNYALEQRMLAISRVQYKKPRKKRTRRR